MADGFEDIFGDFGEAPDSADLFDNDDSEEANRLRRESAKRANDIRAEAYNAVRRGSVDLKSLIYLSHDKNLRAVGKMRIHRMLASRPGWDEASAASALFHYRIGEKDTLVSIRNNETKIAAVDALLTSTSAKWLSRPEMPKGWPFFGKLTDVLGSIEDISSDSVETDLSELDAVSDAVDAASHPDGATPSVGQRHRLEGGYDTDEGDAGDAAKQKGDSESFRPAEKWRPWESASSDNAEESSKDIDVDDMLNSLSDDDGDDDVIEGLIQESGF
jgi:hypothetical protein